MGRRRRQLQGDAGRGEVAQGGRRRGCRKGWRARGGWPSAGHCCCQGPLRQPQGQRCCWSACRPGCQRTLRPPPAWRRRKSCPWQRSHPHPLCCQKSCRPAPLLRPGRRRPPCPAHPHPPLCRQAPPSEGGQCPPPQRPPLQSPAEPQRLPQRRGHAWLQQRQRRLQRRQRGQTGHAATPQRTRCAGKN